MKSLVIAAAALILSSSISLAQTGQPTYQGDPDTYKLLFEDENFRVLVTNWKASSTDKPHTHPVPGIAYHLTDCKLKIHNADGTTRDVTNKAGEANPVPIAAQPHRAENVTSTDCRSIIVERK
jgi:hypothetical protein